MKVVENFIANHSVINDNSPMNKSTLVLTDDGGEEGFKSISYGFSNDFHYDIAQGYECIVNRFRRIVILGDQDDKNVIEILRVFPCY